MSIIHSSLKGPWLFPLYIKKGLSVIQPGFSERNASFFLIPGDESWLVIPLANSPLYLGFILRFGTNALRLSKFWLDFSRHLKFMNVKLIWELKNEIPSGYYDFLGVRTRARALRKMIKLATESLALENSIFTWLVRIIES